MGCRLGSSTTSIQTVHQKCRPASRDGLMLGQWRQLHKHVTGTSLGVLTSCQLICTIQQNKQTCFVSSHCAVWHAACVYGAGDTPRWVYLFAAFSVVFYTWLDCFDGKQARRTGTSSPLGQLFDHGCDALSVNLLLANIGCSLGMTCGWAHAIGNVLVSSRLHTVAARGNRHSTTRSFQCKPRASSCQYGQAGFSKHPCLS